MAKRDLPPRLHKRGKNYIYTPYVEGRVKWHNLGPDKTTALSKWAEMEGGDTGNKTVGDALHAYLDSKEFAELAKRTQEEYGRYVQYHLMKVFGSTLLADVQPSHISQYVHKKGYVGNRHRSVLSNAYQLANLTGWCEMNPTAPYQKIVHKAKEPKRIKEDKEIRIVSDSSSWSFFLTNDGMPASNPPWGYIAKLNLSKLDIDDMGLDFMDRNILNTLIFRSYKSIKIYFNSSIFCPSFLFVVKVLDFCNVNYWAKLSVS